MMGLTVVGKPVATVITSSPGLRRLPRNNGEVRAEKATRLADDPELTSKAYLVPKNSAKRASKASEKRPAVSHMSREESTRLRMSAGLITLPDTGTLLWPGEKGLGPCTSRAYSSDSSRMRARRASASDGEVMCAFQQAFGRFRT